MRKYENGGQVPTCSSDDSFLAIGWVLLVCIEVCIIILPHLIQPLESLFIVYEPN